MELILGILVLVQDYKVLIIMDEKLGGRKTCGYYGCPKEGLDITSDYLYDLSGMICTEEKFKEM